MKSLKMQSTADLDGKWRELNFGQPAPALVRVSVLNPVCAADWQTLLLPPTCRVLCVLRRQRVLEPESSLPLAPGDWVVAIAALPAYGPMLEAVLRDWLRRDRSSCPLE
ncbi:hypothetical protein [Gloeobacter morelensis]|uniref:Uncharacterized protein n=1 Tax=Gloeobacter morelensis MG652769 TaxID=2781736 RepID=A0ABY3PIG8_9CYAN|nr:hypothetical protein [Gloeobacter morelensis]UFP93419.1 hypothetical protein ISF26_16670 [Gloeobacter morelensis MG652769]